MNLAIDVEGINKYYGDKHVVRDLALQVREGEIFGSGEPQSRMHVR